MSEKVNRAPAARFPRAPSLRFSPAAPACCPSSATARCSANKFYRACSPREQPHHWPAHVRARKVAAVPRPSATAVQAAQHGELCAAGLGAAALDEAMAVRWMAMAPSRLMFSQLGLSHAPCGLLDANADGSSTCTRPARPWPRAGGAGRPPRCGSNERLHWVAAVDERVHVRLAVRACWPLARRRRFTLRPPTMAWL